MKLLNNFRISESKSRTGTEISIEDSKMDEVITIHPLFFQKSFKKQRDTLKLLIWWSVKHYLRILFKK